jgi:hypothetical protein
MKKIFIIACIVIASVSAAFVGANGASAQVQFIPPGGSQFNPPPIAPPPPPKIEVPKIPQMDEVARPSYQVSPRPSFSDRVSTCLDEAAGSGLGPAEREAYSRSCANVK